MGVGDLSQGALWYLLNLSHENCYLFTITICEKASMCTLSWEAMRSRNVNSPSLPMEWLRPREAGPGSAQQAWPHADSRAGTTA